MSNSHEPAVWMWIQACEVIDRADRLHRQFFRPTALVQSFGTWEPPIDVFEDALEIIVVVAMPGVTIERLEVIQRPGEVTVRGLRPLPWCSSGHRVRQLEIPYGGFERRIALPAIRLEADEPALTQGCLWLKFRKLDRDPP